MIPGNTPIGSIVWLPRFHQEVVARCELINTDLTTEVGLLCIVVTPPRPKAEERITVKSQGLYLTEREATAQLLEMLWAKASRVESQLAQFQSKIAAAGARVVALDAGAPEATS